jgi:predicted HicB family RNase H-like nuclease
MPIAKKPGSNKNESAKNEGERAAEAFISGASKVAQPPERQNKTPVMLRFDPEVLKRVDAAAKRRGISRSAWIQFTVSRALDQGEG